MLDSCANRNILHIASETADVNVAVDLVESLLREGNAGIFVLRVLLNH